MSVSAEKRTQTLTLPADTRELSKARDMLRTFIEPLEIDDLDKDSLLLAFDEAVTNAITYGPNTNGLGTCSPPAPGDRPTITITLSSHDNEIDITVTDKGPGCEGVVPSDCGPLSTSGRGILLMNRLVDEVMFDRGADCGTTVKLIKRF